MVDAPAKSVFKALSDEKELVRWMPQQARIDLKVGGEYEFKYYWSARNLNSVVKGNILELVPNKKISYTWDSHMIGGDNRITHSVVTWELEQLPEGKTKVTLVQSGVAKQFSDDADKGWSYYLSNLAGYLKKAQ